MTEALAERMQSGGPGLPTVQLAAGAEELRTLQAEVEALGKQQEELRLAEQLFGMNVTSFPHLNKVCSRQDRNTQHMPVTRRAPRVGADFLVT